jgi:hypothetical protein
MPYVSTKNISGSPGGAELEEFSGGCKTTSYRSSQFRLPNANVNVMLTTPSSPPGRDAAVSDCQSRLQVAAAIDLNVYPVAALTGYAISCAHELYYMMVRFNGRKTLQPAHNFPCR